MGNFAEARGHSSVAMGYNIIANLDRSMAFGTYNTEEQSGGSQRIFVLGNDGGTLFLQMVNIIVLVLLPFFITEKLV